MLNEQLMDLLNGEVQVEEKLNNYGNSNTYDAFLDDVVYASFYENNDEWIQTHKDELDLEALLEDGVIESTNVKDNIRFVEDFDHNRPFVIFEQVDDFNSDEHAHAVNVEDVQTDDDLLSAINGALEEKTVLKFIK